MPKPVLINILISHYGILGPRIFLEVSSLQLIPRLQFLVVRLGFLALSHWVLLQEMLIAAEAWPRLTDSNQITNQQNQ